MLSFHLKHSRNYSSIMRLPKISCTGCLKLCQKKKNKKKCGSNLDIYSGLKCYVKILKFSNITSIYPLQKFLLHSSNIRERFHVCQVTNVNLNTLSQIHILQILSGKTALCQKYWLRKVYDVVFLIDLLKNYLYLISIATNT